ncbi:transposase [soil metagenome]
MAKKITYTQEFKDTAIKLAMAGDRPISEVARELGVPYRKLYDWVGAWKAKNEKPAKKSNTSPVEDTGRLEKRIRELEKENEILKKAAAYFAKTLL